MSNKSKNKGKRGEKSVCDMLSECFGLSFMRVFTSGAMFGGKNIQNFYKYTKQQQNLNEGDIIVPEELENFSIEVKNYKDFPFHQIFNGNCKLLDSWIKQASHTNKPFWFLFFKITFKNTFICYPKDYHFILGKDYLQYQNKYIIELAKPFLLSNIDNILNLGNKEKEIEL